jgi:putative tricarboxylic transport membrane protein
MTIAGLVLATIGEGAQFNMPRFTMGIMDLQSGIGFITLAMAMFAIPETLFLILDPNRSGKPDEKQSEITNLRITKDEAKQITPVIARQSLQGFLIGVMPGSRRDYCVVSGVCCGTKFSLSRGKRTIWKGIGKRSCGA